MERPPSPPLLWKCVMRIPDHLRRPVGKFVGWILLIGGLAGTVAIYRWAEPSSPPIASIQNASGTNVAIRLENAPFVGHSNGFKTWSLQAGKIELERLPGGSLSNIESIDLTDIRDGLLFPAPPPPKAIPGTSTPSLPGPDAPAATLPKETEINRITPESETSYGPWNAQFHAKHGHYRSGLLTVLPPELAPLYRLQSEFRLSGGVDFLTREGDHFQAQSITILDLLSKQANRSERRVMCDDGMKVSRKDAQVSANQARFDTTSRTVECLGGARAVIPDGTLQAERMYWSLDAQVLRCPETTTGVLEGIPFTAEGLVVDMKNHRAHANHIRLELRNEVQGKFHL